MNNKLTMILLGLTLLLTPKIEAMGGLAASAGRLLVGGGAAGSAAAGLQYALNNYPTWLAPAVQAVAPAVAPVINIVMPAAPVVAAAASSSWMNWISGVVVAPVVYCAWEHRMEIALALESMKNNIGFYLVHKKITAMKLALDEQRAINNEVSDNLNTLSEAHNQLREEHNQLATKVAQLATVVHEIPGQNKKWYSKIANLFGFGANNNANNPAVNQAV